MNSKLSWLGDRAFGENADALVTMPYKSHQDALRFMQSVLNDETRVGLLQGPRSSGKTTMVRRLSERLPRDTVVAVIDGSRIKPHEMLSRAIAQFGYDVDLESNDELLDAISVFAVQQTLRWQPPILIIDNIDRMFPSALRALNALAKVKANDRFAIRIIVTGGEGLTPLIESEGMAGLAKRGVRKFAISPLSPREALLYLHARLGASGVGNTGTVLTIDVCDRLYEQSGGWPGSMNRFAHDAIGRATSIPLKLADTGAKSEAEEELAADRRLPDMDGATGHLPPLLIVTKDGSTVSECTITENKVLIGRSDFADIVVDDDFVSKLHAVLLLYTDALVLLDLNSANGTTVNSVTVNRTILNDNDVISLGNHRLKVQNVPSASNEMTKQLTARDTLKMKNLVDLRRLNARRLALTASQRKKLG